MKDKEIKTRLEVLDSKLNRLLNSDNTEAQSPYTLHLWLNEYINNYRSPTLSAKWRGVLTCNVKRIKDLTQDKPLNAYKPAEFIALLHAIPYNYTKQVVYNLLKSAYDCAITHGFAVSNPMYQIPEVKHYRNKGKALTIDEQTRLLEVFAGDRLEALYKFYILSGCRTAEALTFRWSDIDERAQQIHIHGTKTYSSNRFIPLFPQMAELFATIPYTSEFVFPYGVNAVRAHFYRITRRNGLKHRLHDLRHTFATRCIESGISLFTLSKWLGHCSIAVTANIYYHVLTDFERLEVSKFNPKI